MPSKAIVTKITSFNIMSVDIIIFYFFESTRARWLLRKSTAQHNSYSHRLHGSSQPYLVFLSIPHFNKLIKAYNGRIKHICFPPQNFPTGTFQLFAHFCCKLDCPKVHEGLSKKDWKNQETGNRVESSIMVLTFFIIDWFMDLPHCLAY